MKITMYELLGMVKDGKKLPKKVKVFDVIYEFDDHYEDYYNKSLERYLFVYMTSEEEWKLSFFLNAEVEILEEEKKISEKIEIYEDEEGHYFIGNHCKKIYVTCDKVNFMVEEFNQLIDYLKSKGDE